MAAAGIEAGSRKAWPPGSAVVAGVLTVVAVLASAITVVGSDALWLSAMGDHIRRRGSIPTGIPFAAAPSTNWVNTTVLGQMTFSVIHAAGSLGPVVAQIVAVTVTLAILAADATWRRATPVATAAVIVAVSLGAVTALFIARAQLLSLVPYALLLVLIRRQHDRPTNAIWWAVPLVAFWGNLHGAVLAGVAVLGCYLTVSRLRMSPRTAVGVGVASLAAICLNPGLLDAPRYYLGVLGGAATSDDSGMWSRLSLANPFDVLLLISATALAVLALGRRLPWWEYAAALGLVVATLSSARHGIWLLLFLAVPAATRVRTPFKDPQPPPARSRWTLMVLPVVGLLGAAALLAARAPSFRAADMEAARITEMSAGRTVLAPEPLAESLAVAGARVWASNPLDAFAHADQTAYLAFMAGDSQGAARGLAASDVVVALPGSPQEEVARSAGFRSATVVGAYHLLTR
ncbi:hypothetical protein GCM10009721_41860 [Terrabacter tumescens]|uniref:Glycosyltransferase RgtA/B/C/D-like domain-containing protein n=1 Tax=Terrabacter tumescens TaxID=60443 RepID=A0ABQ2II08_9MICO|nr:hypothetical protein [Terrabacter tumescens]GGN09592.1 hypothetical protein GCM10009721_41860 [Terrabacter tumescens]